MRPSRFEVSRAEPAGCQRWLSELRVLTPPTVSDRPQAPRQTPSAAGIRRAGGRSGVVSVKFCKRGSEFRLSSRLWELRGERSELGGHRLRDPERERGGRGASPVLPPASGTAAPVCEAGSEPDTTTPLKETTSSGHSC